MRIGQEEIMRIAQRQKGKAPLSDDVVFWLIFGGWAAVVAVLDALCALQRYHAN